MKLSGRVLFISDCHLGAGTRTENSARQERLLDFLDSEASRAATLFILGDLFDFWFEYRHAVPKQHFRVLHALRRLVESSVEVVYFGGNHDFWIGSYLAQEIGCRVYHEPTELTVQGRRLFLAHGDGLGKGDRGYLLLRRLLRNSWAIAGYRALHPDLGIPLAGIVSRLSRRQRNEDQFDATALYRQVAEPRFDRGIDGVLIGHFHHPTHFDREGKEFLILGDWVKNNTFVVLEDSKFQLRRWRQAGMDSEALERKRLPG